MSQGFGRTKQPDSCSARNCSIADDCLIMKESYSADSPLPSRGRRSSLFNQYRATRYHLVLSMIILETDRLVLRWLAAEDAEFIFDLLNQPSFLQFIGDKGVRTIAD